MYIHSGNTQADCGLALALYDIAKESNTNRKTAMFERLIGQYRETEIVEQSEEVPAEEDKKSKRERFAPEKVWECLQKIARNDPGKLLKYIPTRNLEKLFEEYGE